MSKAARVQEIIHDVLFRDDEIVDGVPVVSPVKGDGIMSTFGFHPDRLASHRAEIVDLLSDFDDAFYASKGGGWSFLNFCNTRNGRQWGEHRDMEQLLALGVATGEMQILLPREMWSALPGGMPYIAIVNDPVEAATQP